MTIKTLLPGALLLGLSTCLLVACGGGSTPVRPSVSAQADPPPPPPPPPPPQTGPCPSPVTTSCVVDGPKYNDVPMTGGRQSDYTLTVKGHVALKLQGGDYRFGGGTNIDDAHLAVEDATLRSNVTVQPTGSLDLYGSMTGNLDNRGRTWVWGKLIGNVVNDGVLAPAAYIYEGAVPARIQGNYNQTPNGTLVAVIPTSAYGPNMTGGFLSVTGRADIDGTLRLVPYSDAWGPYPLPGAPLSMQVLHADGGVFGLFAQWTSPGLFITGAVRYLPNDVFFDATAISAAQVMGSAGAQALTVQSAARFDVALHHAAGAAKPDAAPKPEQKRLLATAGLIQRTQSFDQAIRTFDSLSGSGHTAAIEALLLQSSMPDAGLVSRMDGLRPGSRLGAWSSQSSALAASNGAFHGVHAGFDQWLGDRLALGVSLGAGEGNLRFERMGGSARDRSPQWDVYLQRLVGDDAYVLGDIGYGRHQLDTQRAIDLGIGQFAVTGMRNLDLLRTHAESGQHFRIGDGRLTLFGALSHVTLHGAGFAEQGRTGFELVAQPSIHQRTSATTGMRFGQAWRTGNRVTALNLAAGYSQILHAHDNARAAFTGVPDATFALDALPVPRGSGWLQLGLGTGNERWNLGVNYDRLAGNQSLMLHTRLAF